jgi:hypothetical protein
MTSDLADEVQAILEPLELTASSDRKDRGFTVLALVTGSRYVLAIESETRFSVV